MLQMITVRMNVCDCKEHKNASKRPLSSHSSTGLGMDRKSWVWIGERLLDQLATIDGMDTITAEGGVLQHNQEQ